MANIAIDKITIALITMVINPELKVYTYALNSGNQASDSIVIFESDMCTLQDPIGHACGRILDIHRSLHDQKASWHLISVGTLMIWLRQW